MAGVQQFSGSFIQSGSTAVFESGLSGSSINGVLVGDGSLLNNLNFQTSDITLFFGSASGNPPTFNEWITGSGGSHDILLTASSSNVEINHFTFLKLTNTGWTEISDYTGTQNGLASINTVTETLGTGVHQYLLLAMSTASKQTTTIGTTVIINPD